ncbi:MAG: hypothetical protein HY394_02270 [Candidatus Diapherotrites archaeon]|nr:hypothetical protein [Candidatus Diapherotrites archaeon]
MDKKIKFLLVGAGLSILLFIIMGTPTALVPNPFIHYKRMVAAAWLDYFFLASTSIMLAALISLKLYFRSGRGLGAKEIGGGALGFLAFSCPICNALLVALLGGATIMAFVEPLRPLFGVVSIAILGWLIYGALKCGGCNGAAGRHGMKIN